MVAPFESAEAKELHDKEEDLERVHEQVDELKGMLRDETRRADDAEARILDLERRLKASEDARTYEKEKYVQEIANLQLSIGDLQEKK